LAEFLGQGRERKYRERVAPGLAIWADTQAARVGGVRRAWRGPGERIPAFPAPRVWVVSFGASACSELQGL
jgi:hypothetical protein